MFTHVMVGANDLAASKKFYDAVLGAIGLPEGQADLKGRIFYHTKTGSFGIARPIDGKAATHADGSTIGFGCASAEQVKAFHDAGNCQRSQARPASAGVTSGQTPSQRPDVGQLDCQPLR
jgi:catechol 2,3-dioxygenase-like lactoylglutathione lyase family enzyme